MICLNIMIFYNVFRWPGGGKNLMFLLRMSQIQVLALSFIGCVAWGKLIISPNLSLLISKME